LILSEGSENQGEQIYRIWELVTINKYIMPILKEASSGFNWAVALSMTETTIKKIASLSEKLTDKDVEKGFWLL
jgi:hypothetical protein